MKIALISIAVLVLILGVGYLTTNSDTATTRQTSVASTAPTPTANEETSSDTAESTIQPDTPDTPMGATAGTYTSYDAEQIAESDADHILLFFHATWCPSCRALDQDITENAANIPPDTEIYTLDYDIETDLKREYGITTQHSVIEIDSDGNAVSNIHHPLTFDQLISTL